MGTVQQNAETVLLCFVLFLHCQKLASIKEGRMNLHISQDDGMAVRQEDNQFWAGHCYLMRLSQNM